MSAFLIDDSGRLWSAGSRELAAQLGCHHISQETQDLAIKTLGYIGLSLQTNHVEISICPRTVKEPAFYSLVQFLFEQNVERFVLSIFDKGWQQQIFGNQQDLIQRAVGLTEDQTKRSCNAYLSRRRSLETLQHNHPLKALYQLWRSTSGSYTQANFVAALENLTGARYSIVSAVGPSRDLTFREVGAGVALYSNKWPQQAVGVRMKDQPDYELGRWVVESYLDTLLAGEPRFDDVDLIVKRPRQPQYRSCYQRIILPLSDQSTLLSAVYMDSTLDLRSGFNKIGEIAIK